MAKGGGIGSQTGQVGPSPAFRQMGGQPGGAPPFLPPSQQPGPASGGAAEPGQAAGGVASTVSTPLPGPDGSTIPVGLPKPIENPAPAPIPQDGGLVDAGFGTGPLDAQGRQFQGTMTPPTAPAPAPQPSMPAGLPPPAPAISADQRTGMAPVNGPPAKTGASSAADAQAAMMKRAGVTPLAASGQTAQGSSLNGNVPQKKPAPVSRVAPKPTA